jgi:hypothetical protein
MMEYRERAERFGFSIWEENWGNQGGSGAIFVGGSALLSMAPLGCGSRVVQE